jgi:hypothetical protein
VVVVYTIWHECCCLQGANPKVALAAARVLPAESVLALVQLEEVPTKIRCRLLHAFARIYAPFYVDLEVVHDQVQALSQAAHLVAEVRTPPYPPTPTHGRPCLATHPHPRPPTAACVCHLVLTWWLR